MEENKKLILIDGNAIIHRAFHAIPPFRTSSGELVNSVYGFASILLNLLNNEKPDYIAVAFDLKGKTFRHKEYKEYKATRTKASDDLYSQIPKIHQLVAAFKIPIYTAEGFEADDVLGTLAKKAEQHNLNTFIVTGDMDTLQLVTDKTKVMTFVKFSQMKIYDRQAVLDRYGLTPEQVIDMKGLQGDSSDNIKGVAGVGAKTTKTLLQKYETIEGVYENIDEIKGALQNKLITDKESAFLSKRLATIVTDLDMDLNLKECTTHSYDEDTLRAIFEELEFKSLLIRLNNFNKHSSQKKIEEKNIQATLF